MVLDPGDDAACVRWGGTWRIPTKTECQALIDHCTWRWIKQDGVNGMKVTATNGNSIFLPATGMRTDRDLYSVGGHGCYRSSSLANEQFSDPCIASYMAFDGLDGLCMVENYTFTRECGMSIRAVCYCYESQGIEDGYDWVDLGLSVRWATCNYGATKPAEAGAYIAWGELAERTGKYDWTTYLLKDKYTTTDGKTTLEMGDDAARRRMGGTWRIPTLAEWQELYDNCTWTMIERDGIHGYSVEGRNGKTIFLPIVGYLYGNTGLQYYDCQARYWSNQISDEDEQCAMAMCPFYKATDETRNSYNIHKASRAYGASVRAVCDK